MSTSITPPKNVVPVGRVTIGNATYDVAQHPEFVRFFFDLFRRVGGSSGPSNNDLQFLIDELASDIGFSPPPVQPMPIPDDMRSGRLEALEAEVARMGRLINDLQSGYHL